MADGGHPQHAAKLPLTTFIVNGDLRENGAGHSNRHAACSLDARAITQNGSRGRLPSIFWRRLPPKPTPFCFRRQPRGPTLLVAGRTKLVRKNSKGTGGCD